MIDEVLGLSREACIDRWTKNHGMPPPKYTSVPLMQQALAYEAQIKRFLGHSAAVKKALKNAVGDQSRQIANNPKSVPAKVSALTLRAGTHLVREWNGRTYQIEVLEKGFVMDGKTYRSLSAIARKITGAHWSGPRFFGLIS